MTRFKTSAIAAACCLLTEPAYAQLTVTIKDINPDRSTITDADAASGGRVNRVGVAASTPTRVFAASEWGGIFRSDDGGVTWAHLDGHVPTVATDVKVDPTNANRVYATSLYDGRATSRSGINVSTDGGATWTHPATATPPVNFCATATRRAEPAAFRIAIDPANANHVLVGTNCGLAISNDAGITWTFVDPTPNTPATDIRDVLVHHGGIIDVCGADGHLRSTNSGTTWTAPTSSPLPTGRCSLAVSPDESYVLFAVVGTSIFESDDGGQTWPGTYVNPSPQGRIPFVATNKRGGSNYDLWFGDVRLHRGTCTTPSPPAQGGAQRCNASPGWAGPFTRTAGAHDDSGDIAFVPNVAANACPTLFSSDGGVFRNTVTASPACHTPAWTQPTVTPHGLWNFTMSGAHRAGAQPEDLYLGNQDDGTFGSTNAGAPAVTWNSQTCCDGFDSAGDGTRAFTTVCCFSPGRATLLFNSAPGLTTASPPQIGTYPPGNMRTFEHLENILTFAANQYVIATTTGVFVTGNVGASPIVWTQLGAATSPANACGVQVALPGSTPTFFVKSGGCDADRPSTVWSYQGTGAGGTWQQIAAPPGGGGIGIFAVDNSDPQRIIASQIGGASGPRMVTTLDGGTTWSPMTALDLMMTSSGIFQYQNASGPTLVVNGAGMVFNGYPQPTLVAIDPSDPDIVVAGGADSGVFISTNGGARWQLVTDPISPGSSGRPHIPRPYYVHFDHDPPGGDINLFIGTRGRGAWRMTFKKVPMPEIQVPSAPVFTPACLGDRQLAALRVCNTSGGDLVVSSITSSNPEFSVMAPSAGFPVKISHDFCFPFEVAFAPTSPGTRTTDLTINSNDPNFPALKIAATATVGQPTAVAVIADTGNFGQLCPMPNAFRDLAVTIDNRGTCPLLITNLSSSSAEFQVPQVLTFPISVAPGANIEIPFRFQPTSAGAKAATLTVATNDPAAPSTVVAVSGSAPPDYVCSPPLFTAIDGAVGPTFGTGRTGNYTVNTNGRFLGSFGPGRRFGAQLQGEYMFYPGRQEGQIDGTLFYRRGALQVGVGGSFKDANVRAEVSPAALSALTATVDGLLTTIRFGAFLSKGLKETDIVGSRENVGPSGAGQPIVVTERVAHTVDALGGTVQVALVPGVWWLDANAAFLHRYSPGVGNSGGAGVRVSRQLLPWLVGMGQFDLNESFLGAHNVGTITFGVTVGRWPKPTDLSNPRNPLGSLVPRIHYEVFDRVR